MLAWASLFGPGLLLILAALPFWQEIQATGMGMSMCMGMCMGMCMCTLTVVRVGVRVRTRVS